MGDLTEMAGNFFLAVLQFIIIVSIIIGIGFFMGYRYGYDKGIKECNNKTIAKQLGYEYGK